MQDYRIEYSRVERELIPCLPKSKGIRVRAGLCNFTDHINYSKPQHVNKRYLNNYNAAHHPHFIGGLILPSFHYHQDK